MRTLRECRHCGAVLAAYAPEGLCPRCMLAGALVSSGEDEYPLEGERFAHDWGAAAAEITSPSPRKIADYEVLEEIGRGGMGVVYKARQRGLNRTVALKMIQPHRLASAAMVQRFRLEAEAAASLRHPNIVATHEVGEHGGQHYFSMDFIEGRSLAEFIADRGMARVEFKRVARWMHKIALAIHHAHQQGILHRDLKPSNILLDTEDEPHVTDFGLARRLEGDSTITLTGEVLGSPAYMAPEQAGSQRRVTVAADIYSLGGILYELLTGRPPFGGPTPAETLHQVLHSDVARPRLTDPSLPRDLETICLKCLDKEPARRYGSAREVGDELERYLRNEPIHARPAGLGEKLWRWSRRNPVTSGLSAVTLTLLLVVAVGSPLALLHIQRARQSAEERSYASDMNLAQQALAANNMGRAERLLYRHRPPAGQADRRGWEWRYLWEQCRSDALFTLCRRSNSINSLAVSHDGRTLAIGERSQGVLSLWDLETRRETDRLRAGDGFVHVAFSPQQPWLAFSMETELGTTSRLDQVRLWDQETRKVIVDLPLKSRCGGLVFSADGQTLLTTTLAPGNEVALWSVPAGTKLTRFGATRTFSSGSPFAATRDLSLAAHSFRDTITLTDLATGKTRWTADAAEEEIFALAFSPDGTKLASAAGTVETAIRLWDAASGRELGQLEGHSAYVLALVFWPDGKTLASASADQTIRWWDLDTLRPLGTLRGHRHEVWRLALLPDAMTLVSGCKDGSVNLWSTASTGADRALVTLPATVRVWRFTPDGNSVVSVDDHGHAARWDGDAFQGHQPLLELGSRAVETCFSPDTRFLAAGYADGMMEVWDVRERARLKRFKAGTGPVRPWQFLGHGSRLIVGRKGIDTLQEWYLDTLREGRSWPSAQAWTRGTLSPDETWCFTRGVGGAASLRNLVTGREANLGLETLQAFNAAFSPDGRRFAVASSLGYCRLWELDSMREVATLGGFLQGVHSVAFSPDGKRLAAGSNGREAIKLWNADNYQELLTLEGQGSRFSSCSFSPDGRVLGALNWAGVLHLWCPPTWEEISRSEGEGHGEP